MEWLPDAIRATGEVFKDLGLTSLILLLATGLIGFAVYMNRKGTSPSKEGTPALMAPLTCAWAGFDGMHLTELRHDIDHIKVQINKIEDRTRNL